jgi:hypothetical protein
MKQIPLTQGKVALVSDCEHTFLMQWKWFYGGGYAVRNGSRPKRERIFMHKVIAARKGLSGQVDHRNQNKLDNQRRNLRLATGSQNNANCLLRSNNTSGFTGVSWHKNKWEAYVCGHKKRKYLGRFPNTKVGKKAAARAYNKAALEHFGEYACLNIV